MSRTTNLGIPSGLANLDTSTTGGTARDRRFAKEIVQFWHVLTGAVVDVANQPVAEVSLVDNGRQFGRHPKTIRRWIAFFEARGWVRVERAGGRGRGVTVRVLWLERRRPVSKKGDTRSNGLNDSKKPIGFGAVMGTARRLLDQHPRLDDHDRDTCLQALGRWMKSNPGEGTGAIVAGLEARADMPRPRWARGAAGVFRWFYTLVEKLSHYGADWWRRLEILRWSGPTEREPRPHLGDLPAPSARATLSAPSDGRPGAPAPHGGQHPRSNPADRRAARAWRLTGRLS